MILPTPPFLWENSETSFLGKFLKLKICFYKKGGFQLSYSWKQHQKRIENKNNFLPSHQNVVTKIKKEWNNFAYKLINVTK